MKFDTLGLRPELLQAVAALGFEFPTPIQEKMIGAALDRNGDLIGLAQTGTGKTAAFGLPMIHHIDFSRQTVQGLVICPTRELCLQIAGDLAQYAQYIDGGRIAALYGGGSIRDQMRGLKKNPRVVVATPGRLVDLINRKAVNLDAVDYLVLDEADEMLNMGFQEDIQAILSSTPETRRTWLLSATMSGAAARIADRYMTEPERISVGSPNRGAENIAHTCYVVKEIHRYDALKRLIDYAPEIFGLVFCRTREETRMVSEKLMADGYEAEALHGDLSQAQRNFVMRKFRSRAIRILVATDVAARGLDVDDISHVIHYNLPDEAERYTHRSGRTARAGKSGASMVLLNTRDVRKIPEVETKSKVKFVFGKIPDGSAICEKQLAAMVERLKNTEAENGEIDAYLPKACETLASLSKEELIKRVVALEFNRFLDYYKDAGDINATIHPKKRETGRPGNREVRRGRLPRSKTTRFFINVGKLDKLREGAIVRLVCEKSGISSKNLGNIELKREFSFFEVEKSVAGRVLDALKGAKLDGRAIQARFAE